MNKAEIGTGCLSVALLICLLAVPTAKGLSLDDSGSASLAIKEELTRRGVQFASVNVTSNGADALIWLSMAGMSNPALASLTGMRIEAMDLSLVKSCDWNALSNMPLQWLDVSGSSFADAGLLQKLPLRVLFVSYTKVADLKPIEKMKLKVLHIEGTAIKALEPLRLMELEVLNVSRTQVSDLRPIENMPISSLMIDGTGVRDVYPLRNCRIEYLTWSPDIVTNGISVIRNMTTLKGINGLEPKEFWQIYDDRNVRALRTKAQDPADERSR